MKKNLYLALILTILSTFTFGSKVSVDRAGRVGLNFYYQRATLHQKINKADIKVTKTFTRRYHSKEVYYIFNVSTGGFVVVSADDAVTPVLAYSPDGDGYSVENQPPQFSGWMEGYAKQIEKSIIDPGNRFDVSYEWQRLSNASSVDQDKIPLTEVPPLLISTWDQGSFYNMLCPSDPAGPNGHVWAGCVATAMSQVMYYYRWPVNGSGSHCYVPSGYPQQCADFGNTTYKWDEMSNYCSPGDTSIATLIWHAGISVDMMYSPNGSGAYSEDALTSMIQNFRYCPTAHLVARDGMPADQYTAILRDNLDHKRVMYYDGYGTGGHAFNMDGYQGTDYFHFNWGWSGSFNGYFYLNNLNPGGDDFTNGQRAMVELYPDTINNVYPPNCTGQHELSALRGSFEDGSGPVKDYRNNINCSWLINPQSPSDSITKITVAFNRFSTETGNDVVTIYKGATTTDSIAGTYSGDELPPAVNINSSKALVTFASNGSGTKPGWYISYSSKSYDWCNGMKVLTTPQGSLTDGSGSHNYKNSVNCRWEIIPPSGQPVHLSFNSFKTESEYDKLKIYDPETQQLLAEYSGDFPTSSLPPTVISPSGKMFLVFSTNSSRTDEGWSVNWTTFPLGISNLTSGFQIYPNPASGNVNIQFNSKDAKPIITDFYSPEGKLQLSVDLPVREGLNRIPVDISSLHKGVYLLKITGDQQYTTLKLLVD